MWAATQRRADCRPDPSSEPAAESDSRRLIRSRWATLTRHQLLLGDFYWSEIAVPLVPVGVRQVMECLFRLVAGGVAGVTISRGARLVPSPLPGIANAASPAMARGGRCPGEVQTVTSPADMGDHRSIHQERAPAT